MLNFLWSFLIILSIVCGIFTNRTELTASSILVGCKMSLDFLISIAGIMSFWTGMIKIVQKAKFDILISKLLKPIIKILFPDLKLKENKNLVNSMCITATASFLGLSNAVTPFAIDTVSKIERLDINANKKNNILNTFIILNISNIQLMPNILISLRKQHGSSSSFGVLPYIWLTSLFSLIFGILILKLLDIFDFCYFKKFLKNKIKKCEVKV